MFSIDEEDESQTFKNTNSDSETVTIPVTSTKTTGSVTSEWDWMISSYQIGTESPVSVEGTSFTAGGLTVSKSGNELSVISLAMSSVNRGSHDYWINSNGRTDDLDLSPADWSSVSETSPIDLSKMDFTKDDYSSAVGAFSMTTANCYIIRHAGTYKLPLVYGNAVVNGNDNEQSFYPNVTGGEYRLSRFVNHNGNGITSAFIENNTGCTAASCSIVRQDEASVIKNLSIIGNTLAAGNYTKDNVRYLQFTIDDATICQNNSVIAIKDGSGNIMWSWHIWTTNDPALLTPAIPVTNKAGIIYNFFPLGGLGYVEPTDYPSKDQVIITLKQSLSGNIVNITVDQPMVLGFAKSNYYQYGRKDPMCRKDSPQFGVFKRDGIGKVNLQTAIMNPNTFYRYDSGLHNWCSATYYNLWTGKKSIGGEMEDDAEIIKTVYDPSPVGYKMPASNAFTGFTTTGKESSMISQFNVSGSYNTGWNFYTNSSHNSTIFFPALGYREISGGEVKNAGSKAYYWTAITVFEGDGYHLRFASDIVCPLDTGYGREAGFTIRPVKEQ